MRLTGKAGVLWRVHDTVKGIPAGKLPFRIEYRPPGIAQEGLSVPIVLLSACSRRRQGDPARLCRRDHPGARLADRGAHADGARERRRRQR